MSAGRKFTRPKDQIVVRYKSQRSAEPVIVDGAVITGPFGSNNNWGISFLVDTVELQETVGQLMPGTSNQYQLGDTKVRDYRSVVSTIVMSEQGIRSLVRAISERIEKYEKLNEEPDLDDEVDGGPEGDHEEE